MPPRWRTSLVLASTIAAAASAGLPGASPPAGAAAREPITFAAPVKMPMYGLAAASGGASEPSIAVAADGTIYVTAACCVPVPAPTWYSKDGGRTFRELTAPGRARDSLVGAEGDFAIDDADRVMFADLNFPLGMVVTRWRDRGDTWERTVVASEKTVPLEDRPWVAWGEGSLYMYVNSGLQTTWVYQSYDGGLTFNPIAVGSFSGNFPTMMTANRQDGAIWLLGKNGFTGADLVSDVTTDNGETWVHTDVATASRGATSPTIGLSLATDEAGNGYAVWSTSDATGCDVELATSTDHGRSWSEPVKVNAATGCATFPWVDAGDAGHAVVAWYHSDTKKNQASMPGSATWHVQAAVSTDALAASPTFVEARLPNVTVDRGTLTTGYGQSGSNSRSLLDFFEVAIGPDGLFHIAYAENTSQPGVENVWYVRQASGPRLHADRSAPATAVSVSSAVAGGGALRVEGASTFRKAPTVQLFPPPPTNKYHPVGGEVTRVGPDSGELLLTLTTLPNGVPGYDGIPRNSYSWPLDVGETRHELIYVSRDVTGPRFLLDGEPIGGTVDGLGGRSIARLPLKAVGGGPGTKIVFHTPSPVGFFTSGTFTYEVPSATVTLSLLRNGMEVASGEAALSDDATSFTGGLDVSSLEAGGYELVATACYAGACAQTTTAVTV